MAPAIAHFLVGAAFLLLVATPLMLRYDLDRELAIWLLPIGGVWGIAPDVHHISPVAAETLYGFHHSPWMELFALHYTLDRPAVRAQEHWSIFASILLFIVAVAGFRLAVRVRNRGLVARRPLEHAFVVCAATAAAGTLATIVLGVGVSIQEAFPAVAGLVGSSSVLVGGLLVTLGGGLLSVGTAAVVESDVVERARFEPTHGAFVGASVGLVSWIGGVVVGVPLVSAAPFPSLHVGSLGTLLVFGVVFGAFYAVVRGAFRDPDIVVPGNETP
ncbi:hypothetical protein GCM10027435_02640 [Haloparvum alkalitolerans]|uniref:hypothetical protein n=1 Tax=Haloparvum alkalitolerans TaxID=1042953 RepID=UPI003CF6D8C7